MKRISAEQTKEVKTVKEPGSESMLADFFHEELKEVFSAEQRLSEALPELKMAASSGELVAALEAECEQTRDHVYRVEEIFELLGYRPEGKKSEAMEGLIKEAKRAIEETENGTATRDTALIIAAQKIDHYEIAVYAGMQQVAVSLGYDSVASILQNILSEKKETDMILTFISENHINYEPVIEE
jgi:ferritin-like metal-binding protein YciE